MIQDFRFPLSLVLAALAFQAQAGEVYAPIGIPGIGIGYAQPVNSMFTLRADFMTLGSRSKDTTEDGITYQGRYKLQRTALLVDLFPMAGSFRFTAGAVLSTYKGTLDASGASGTITIGDTTYTGLSAADGMNVEIKFPSTTPYLGIGWGHQAGSGLRFSFDIGAAIGRAKLTASPRGQLASEPTIQADIDKELAELRDGVGKVRAIPQLSFGIGYSF
ncbi:conserved exported hypothetical protein [Rubrivivax sp. A210]|uniref:hypothetical protein n=1 Tax=Rubrivivax sp. A210 TaxID=2772301 RepID=UPI001918538A|nr:hypothetical protein [Rubrivivax sp. A210]CAD5373703.1 conserved exported hypothetical protein [Rubrivivax sp. A210]